jgi:hypothetical protein
MRRAGFVWLRTGTLASTVQKVIFEVPPSVVIKRTVFWDVTPCSMFAAYRYQENSTASIFRID